MKPTLSSAARTRLALVAFASLWLGACGGGGGGDETAAAAPPPLASAAGSPPPAAGGGTAPPAAGPAAFQAWGPLIVDANVAPESSTSAARLGTGASVVAWVKDGALQAQRFDASGARVGTPLRIVENGMAGVRAFSIAPLGNGEWIATWAGSTPGATGPTVLFQRFTAAGEAIGGPVQAGGVYAAVGAPLARATADGGFVIGWSASSGTPQEPPAAYVARFAADGTSLSGPVAVSAMAGSQGAVGVNPLANGTVLVTWTQDLVQSRSGYVRPFDSSGQPSGPERQIVATTTTAFASAPLAGNRVAVAWGFPGTQLNWQILGASGAPLGDPASSIGTGEMTRVAVVEADGGSFHVLHQNAEQTPRSNTSTISVQRVGASGAADGSPSVIVRRRLFGLLADGSTAPQAGPDFSASGGADGHYVVSYQVSADTSVEVHAQAK